MSSEKRPTQGQNKVSNLDSQLSKARKSTKDNRSKSVVNINKQCRNNCKKHNFQMQPLDNYSSFMTKKIIDPVKVNFCSKGNSTTHSIPTIAHELKTQPHVPLFLNEDELKKYQRYLGDHQTQFKEAVKKGMQSDGEEQMLVPIPKTKNCQVCKIKIETDREYNIHISSNQHKENIRKSLGNKFICQSAEMFQEKRRAKSLISKKRLQLKMVADIFKQAKKALKGIIYG